MKKWLLSLILIIAAEQLSAQDKYAIFFSRLASVTGEDKIVARNNISIIKESLQAQGFLASRIYADTTILTAEAILRQLNLVLSQVKKRDFVFIYFDLPSNETGIAEGDLNFIPDANKTNQVIPFSTIRYQLSKTAAKIADPSLFFVLFDLDELRSMNALAGGYSAEVQLQSYPFDFISSVSSGQRAHNHQGASIFARVVSSSLSSITASNFTVHDFFNKIRNESVLYSTKQVPAFSGTNADKLLFNGLYVKYPPHYLVTEKLTHSEIIINAGTKTNIIEGTIVRIYQAYSDTFNRPFITGTVTGLSENKAIVKLEKPLSAEPDKVWAYICQVPLYQRRFTISLNETYGGGSKNNKVFKEIITSLKQRSSLYSNFVNKGGDLQISNIEKLRGDSLELTIVNPQSGQVTAILKIKDAADLESMVNFCEQLAKYEYLSKLSNTVPGLEVELQITDTLGKAVTAKENGYDILYEGDEMVFTITNKNRKRLYYALIDLTQDKQFTLLGSELADPAEYVIDAFASITLRLVISAPFGKERIKVLTSDEPVNLDPFRLTYSRQYMSKFQLIHIQDYDFEARSKLYDRRTAGTARTSIASYITGSEKKNEKRFSLSNPGSDRVYFNLLKQNASGTYQLLFPNNEKDPSDCFFECNSCGPKKEFSFTDPLLEYDQLVTVYSDRPFNLNSLVTDDRSLNDLLVQILRNGRIAGSPLNKIGMVQELYKPGSATVSRDGENVLIKLVTPRATNERGLRIAAASQLYDINGFAMCADNKPVKLLRINGTAVNYDPDLKFFENTLTLSAGINKVVIEATDEKGFTATKVLEFELKNNVVAAAGKGKNYFLGIGIDAYQTWPVLNNAKNDVIGFSNLLKSKFGFDSIRLLLDAAATRANIINNIRNFLKSAGPNDNIIIYLSGHGNEDQLADGDYYFIPQEAGADDVTSAVKSTDIMDNFIKIRAKRCLLIVDACYSGMITNTVNNKKSLLTSSGDQVPAENAACKWVITSGRATKVSDGEAGKNSPFATILINYLRDHDDASSLKLPRLIDYLKEKVHDLNKLQEPLGIPIEGKGDSIFTMPAKDK